MSVAHCVYCPNLKHELEDSNRSSWQHSCDSQQWDSVASVHYTLPHTHHTHTCTHKYACMPSEAIRDPLVPPKVTCGASNALVLLQILSPELFSVKAQAVSNMWSEMLMSLPLAWEFPLSSSIIENIPRHHKIISNLLYIVNQKDLGNNPKQKQYYFLPKEDNPNRSM